MAVGGSCELKLGARAEVTEDFGCQCVQVYVCVCAIKSIFDIGSLLTESSTSRTADHTVLGLDLRPRWPHQQSRTRPRSFPAVSRMVPSPRHSRENPPRGTSVLDAIRSEKSMPDSSRNSINSLSSSSCSPQDPRSSATMMQDDMALRSEEIDCHLRKA